MDTNSETLLNALQSENHAIVNLVSKLEISEQPKPVPKFKKVRKTSFWGVEVDRPMVHANPMVAECLTNNPELVPLKNIHTTLLFVGGKDNNDEQQFFQYMSKKCTVVVSGHGYNKNALALRVESVKFVESGENVPSYATIQHITIALAKNVMAVDSVKTLQGEGTIVDYDTPLILEGELKRNICFVKVPLRDSSASDDRRFIATEVPQSVSPVVADETNDNTN